MKTISVSQLKARLSEELRHVQAGEEVVVTDRGHPVARLLPYTPSATPALERLAAAGLVRIGPGVDANFWELGRAADPSGTLRAAHAAEREDGW